MISTVQLLVEARQKQPPANQGRERAEPEELCRDQQTPIPEEVPLEDFVDGSGI